MSAVEIFTMIAAAAPLGLSLIGVGLGVVAFTLTLGKDA